MAVSRGQIANPSGLKLNLGASRGTLVLFTPKKTKQKAENAHHPHFRLSIFWVIFKYLPKFFFLCACYCVIVFCLQSLIFSLGTQIRQKYNRSFAFSGRALRCPVSTFAVTTTRIAFECPGRDAT